MYGFAPGPDWDGGMWQPYTNHTKRAPQPQAAPTGERHPKFTCLLCGSGAKEERASPWMPNAVLETWYGLPDDWGWPLCSVACAERWHVLPVDLRLCLVTQNHAYAGWLLWQKCAGMLEPDTAVCGYFTHDAQGLVNGMQDTAPVRAGSWC